MTRAFHPIEIKAPEVGGAPVLPFEHIDGKYFVAREEGGVLYHQPFCTDFVRDGWCAHLNNARALAEHPRAAFSSAAHSLAVFGVEDGRPLTAIAADIGDLARAQSGRQHFKAEWEARQARTEAEREADALDALRRHSKTGGAA